MRSKKNIIVTGGTRGLGKAICSSLIKQGHKVATFSREAIVKDSYSYNVKKLNLNSTEQIDEYIKTLYNLWGHIDVLINNAGVVNLKPLAEYTYSDINSIIDTNVKGTFYITQKVLEYMTVGKIINIGSTRSITGAKNKSLYSMSKFALRSLTQCINEEYTDIKSSIVCPGRLEPEGKVMYTTICSVIDMLLTTDIDNNIPEVIIGGQL